LGLVEQELPVAYQVVLPDLMVLLHHQHSRQEQYLVLAAVAAAVLFREQHLEVQAVLVVGVHQLLRQVEPV
jgi:hypothetical protein